MSVENILKELAKLSPEEQKALKSLFGGTEEPSQKEKHAPQAPKAGRVYFFQQNGRYETSEIKKDDDKMMKISHELPPRVIAVDEKMAWRLIWKNKGKFQYLGRSSGDIWRRARTEGKSVSEAQRLEYDEMIKNPDLTVPNSREKTFFQGKTMAVAAKGVEIPWAQGFKQL